MLILPNRVEQAPSLKGWFRFAGWPQGADGEIETVRSEKSGENICFWATKNKV